MATADEILENMEDQVEDGVIVIDNDMRTITVPEDIRLLGVESDKEVRRLRFRMPATYGEVDLSEFELRINYLNAAGQGDIYIVKDKETKDGTIEFSWLVGEFATMYKGIVQFIVCAKKINGSVIEKEFNTTRASLPVLEGLEVPQVISEQNPDIIEQILYRLGELEGGGTGGASINDTTPSTTTTYSSVKVDELLNEQKEANDAQDKEIAKRAKDADLAAVAKSGSYNDLSNKPTIPTVPESLKNPHKLTFTGAVTAEYDGSEAVSVEIPEGGGDGGSSGGNWELIQDITVEESVHTLNIDVRKNGEPTWWNSLFCVIEGVYDGPSDYSGGVNLKVGKGYNNADWDQFNFQIDAVFHTAGSGIPTGFELHWLKDAGNAMYGMTYRNGGKKSDLLPRIQAPATDYDYLNLYFNVGDSAYNIGAGTRIRIWGIQG